MGVFIEGQANSS